MSGKNIEFKGYTHVARFLNENPLLEALLYDPKCRHNPLIWSKKSYIWIDAKQFHSNSTRDTIRKIKKQYHILHCFYIEGLYRGFICKSKQHANNV